MALTDAHMSEKSVKDERVIEAFVPSCMSSLEQGLLFVATKREGRR
jgi:hypothetical protein